MDWRARGKIGREELGGKRCNDLFVFSIYQGRELHVSPLEANTI